MRRFGSARPARSDTGRGGLRRARSRSLTCLYDHKLTFVGTGARLGRPDRLTLTTQDAAWSELPTSSALSPPASGFAINGSAVCAFPDVTSLNCSVRVRDDTDISQACKTEATASMQLGFSRCAVRSVLVPPALMGFPDLLWVKSCAAQTVRVEQESHEVI